MTTNHHSGRAFHGGRVKCSLKPARLAGSAALRWAGTYLAWGERKRLKRERFVMHTAKVVTRTMGRLFAATSRGPSV